MAGVLMEKDVGSAQDIRHVQEQEWLPATLPSPASIKALRARPPLPPSSSPFTEVQPQGSSRIDRSDLWHTATVSPAVSKRRRLSAQLSPAVMPHEQLNDLNHLTSRHDLDLPKVLYSEKGAISDVRLCPIMVIKANTVCLIELVS